MFPAQPDNEAHRQARVDSWRNRTAPGSFPVDTARRWEETHYQTATLTPLGERLLGLTPW